MLGDLIAQLDRPDVADGVLDTLDPEVAEHVEQKAAQYSMEVADFVAGAVREFIERADDGLWFELLAKIRKSDDPGLAAVQTILLWVVTAP